MVFTRLGQQESVCRAVYATAFEDRAGSKTENGEAPA